jgi:hypothetical protein
MWQALGLVQANVCFDLLQIWNVDECTVSGRRDPSVSIVMQVYKESGTTVIRSPADLFLVISLHNLI